MKHRNTVERRSDRLEFVYKYRVEILVAEHQRKQRLKLDRLWSLYLPPVAENLVKTAREELGYSPATIDWDVFGSLVTTLKKHLSKND